MATHNVWTLFNLSESPFFQAKLEKQESARYSLDLFVGRKSESNRLLRAIVGSASSRNTVEGDPGVGKTTLVEHVKGSAERDRYLSRSTAVSVSSSDDLDSLLVGILSYVYETVVTTVPNASKNPAVERARALVRTYRETDLSGSITVLGTGAGASRAQRTREGSFVSPRLVVPQLLIEISSWVRNEVEEPYSGIIVHLNNLENLAAPQVDEAGIILRDLRDVFLLEGYHFILVGTSNVLRAVMAQHAQLRGVFGSAQPLSPLEADEVTELLEKRYEFLKLDEGLRVRAPVEDEAVRTIYPVFFGDVRGFLRALDIAALEILGYGEPPDAPMSLDGLTRVLWPIYRREAEATLSELELDYLDSLAEGPEDLNQADLQDLWGVSQGRVSSVVNRLTELGYVREVPRSGRRKKYQLTGPGRLAVRSAVSDEQAG